MLLKMLQSVRWLGLLLAFILIALVHQPLDAQSGPAFYYYYQGTRVPLDVNPTLVAVRFDASLSSAGQRAIAEATGQVGDFQASTTLPVGGLVFVPIRAGSDPLAAAARFRERAGVQFVSPVFDFESAQLAETGEFLARFAETVSDTEIANINRANNVTLVGTLPNSDRVLVLKPAPGETRSARELANLYIEQGLAEFAEPNFVVRAARPVSPPPLASEKERTPNDGNFGLQWSLRNTQQFLGSIAGADIKATEAWNLSQGALGVKIAIIDEGVFASHPELAGKVLTGYNALNGSSNTTPKTNDHHGTAMAGIIAAHSDNGVGISGICWFCQLLPVKVAETDSNGNWVTSFATLASGIDWAWQNGADVLNNSWTTVAPSDSVQLAIINARFSGRGGKGSTLVFASGNQNAATVSFPASLNSYVIAVGASNWCDQRKAPINNPCNNSDASWGSNYGTALDLVAPGEAIYTTCNGSQCTAGTYSYLSGTSLATPMVSGAVALLYASDNNLTPDQVQTLLQNGAHDLSIAGRDNETGYGRLDLYRTLTALYNLKIKIKGVKKFLRPGETVQYKIKYFNTGSSAMANTQIFVTLPENTTYVSSTPAFVLQSGRTYRLSLGTLGPNATGTAFFRVQVQPSAAGQPITFTTSITGAFPEFTSGDNTATKTSLGVRREVFLPHIINSGP